MILGRVIGTIWATRKEPSLDGTKLQIVEQVSLEFKPTGTFLVAVDAVEAVDAVALEPRRGRDAAARRVSDSWASSSSWSSASTSSSSSDSGATTAAGAGSASSISSSALSSI